MAEASSSIQNQSLTVSDGNHTVDALAFRKALLDWGQKNFRVFPWRFTSDPYQILIAEVMLHRTQARQVVPVYKEFIDRYPDLSSLVEATEEDLSKMLHSLGLHWRVRLFHEMVAELMVRFNGHIPSAKSDLLSLPGISDYITSAVRCFAWNQADAVIDTNTVRIVGRVFGLQLKDSLRRNRQFKTIIEELVDPQQSAAYNYALLDLANKVCLKAQEPDCIRCPLLRHCQYGAIVSNLAT